MTKCPYCHFENEAGALFCEQCKSDLGWVEPNAIRPAPESGNGATMPAEVVEHAEASAVAEPVHAAAMVEEPIVAGAIPIAEASPVYALADTIGVETMKGNPAAAEVEPAPVENPAVQTLEGAIPVVDRGSTPSTIEQIVSPKAAEKLLAGGKPKLIVLRGQRQSVEYQIYEGDNYIGRADDKAVDVDLEDQEPPDRIWSSRQHAVITFESGHMSIEDLNSTNGTYLNRSRIEPGKKVPLSLNDVIQIGTVQLKVVV
jgi:hypothetical protein